MTWHLAGHTHRWWTPSDLTGSLQRVRFGTEAWHSCCVLSNHKFRVKGRKPGPLALTEQMFSPPPSLERWPTLTAEKSWLKFGLEWQQHNDCSSSVTVWIRRSLYLDGAPLNSGSQFSSTHSQKGSFRLAGSHLINTKPLYSSHFLLYLLMDQNKISKHVHDISGNPSAPSFQWYDSTEGEVYVVCILSVQSTYSKKRE